MSGKEILDFLIDNWKIIRDNWYIFLVWTLMCFVIFYGFFKLICKKQKNEISRLKEEVKRQKEQLDIQKDGFEKLNDDTWLSASRIEVDSPAAKGLSEALTEKYKK